MTYNFDPDRWYANERAALDAERRAGTLSAERYEAALDDLERRLDEMQKRLDGSYQLPGPGVSDRAREGRAVTARGRFEIRIAGFGGQGVVTIGRVLGTAFSIHGNLNSVNTQSYGPESRGGACRSEVVVADGEINYPYVRKADVLVALSQVALDTYVEDLKAGGTLVTDAEAVRSIPHPERFRGVAVPTLSIAHAAGDVKFQNMAALGALYAVIAERLAEDHLVAAIRDSVPAATLTGNLAAFETGKTFVRTNFSVER
jgi:2-oxoglutarate ferredoxin oxidoreductase subunit gamma